MKFPYGKDPKCILGLGIMNGINHNFQKLPITPTPWLTQLSVLEKIMFAEFCVNHVNQVYYLGLIFSLNADHIQRVLV